MEPTPKNHLMVLVNGFFKNIPSSKMLSAAVPQSACAQSLQIWTVVCGLCAQASAPVS